MKRKFCKIDKEEQETNILVDYMSKVVKFYTSKKTIYQRLLKVLPEPNEIYYIKDDIAGACWIIKFKDNKSLRKILSKTLIIGT